MKTILVLTLTTVTFIGCSSGATKADVPYMEPELTEERRLELENQFNEPEENLEEASEENEETTN
jgi:hypothetical protein